MRSNNETNRLLEKIKKYRFEIRHLTLLFIILIVFQLVLSYIQKNSLEEFLTEAQEWYQKDTAERIANLTSTSLEMVIENMPAERDISESERRKIIESFNIIFSQQLLYQHVEEVCLIISKDNHQFVIDDGEELFQFIAERSNNLNGADEFHKIALTFFRDHSDELIKNEEIFSKLKNDNSFHILVPFVPRGEYIGAFYMKNNPDFTLITKEIIASYDEATVIYSSFILLGLLAMYYISSYTVRERDEAQRLLFNEQEESIKKQVRHEKESLFTKRIYHTHHKAEKVMGFIKEDLRILDKENIEEVKNRVNKYSNFISRVIYDMKWYDPPMSAIRSDIFNTDLNSVVKFLVDNLFLRISRKTDQFNFDLELDERVPRIRVNEFVIWEILEPIIQNSIDHAGNKKVIIKIRTRYIEPDNVTILELEDNGPGIDQSMLENGNNGIKKIFSEDVTTKYVENKNAGYGCYIAYNIAVSKCGWKMDAVNIPNSGCKFSITIKHT